MFKYLYRHVLIHVHYIGARSMWSISPPQWNITPPLLEATGLFNRKFSSEELDEIVLAYPVMNKERLRTYLSVL
jgi:hypothetical protein